MTAMLNQARKALCSKPAIAGVLLGLYALVLTMAYCEALHHAIHTDAGAAHHQCAATLLSSGQVDAASPELNVVCAPPIPAFALFPTLVPLPADDYFLLPGRDPPAFLT